MIKTLKMGVLVGALVAFATPVLAEDIATPLGPLDIDPFHILSPAPAPAPAAPAPVKKKHHHHHKAHAKKK